MRSICVCSIRLMALVSVRIRCKPYSRGKYVFYPLNVRLNKVLLQFILALCSGFALAELSALCPSIEKPE
jgi:hypothetical protein